MQLLRGIYEYREIDINIFRGIVTKKERERGDRTREQEKRNSQTKIKEKIKKNERTFIKE